MIRARPALTVVLALLAGVCALAPAAPAQAAEGGEAPTWRLEQPVPPELPTGQKSNIPTGLGRIGDIEFWAPNRGVLITDGNSTIKPGVWYYNGTGWREIASVCGATDGRIAWAGPEEFWTVSDGRKGQSTSEGTPPLADNTLCHFAPATEGEQRPLEVVGSYASLAFLPSSYQAMDGAGCLSSEDCWFAGGPLPDEQVGSFHLHWNGHQMEAEPGPQGHAVSSISRFGPVLYEGVRIESGDLDSEEEPPTEPSLIHAIEPTGVQPRFVSLFPTDLSLANKRLPIYSTGESPEALTGPLLASDEGALWAALNPIQEVSKSTPGEITILRENQQEEWSQLLGPETDPVEGNPFNNPANPNRAPLVQRVAPEPPSATEAGEGREQALLALASRFEQQSERSAVASVATIGSGGAVSSVSTLPEGAQLKELGPLGYASDVVCPAAEDCWLATSQGYLFHLATDADRVLPEDDAPALALAAQEPIASRPKDEGVPQTIPDALPEDDSGLPTERPPQVTETKEVAEKEEGFQYLPLLSGIKTKILKGSVLELSFRLSVKGRVQLIAKRKKRVVAETKPQVFGAGHRKLLLQLDRKRWPTELKLNQKALAPLKKVPLTSSNVETVSTGLRVLPQLPSFAGSGAAW